MHIHHRDLLTIHHDHELPEMTEMPRSQLSWDVLHPNQHPPRHNDARATHTLTYTTPITFNPGRVQLWLQPQK